MNRFRWTGIVVLLACAAAAQTGKSVQPQREVVTIDAAAPSHPFPHFWEQMFGSGRAILSLREDYRQDLRAVKRITGFEYVRFHDILDDDVGLYGEGRQGKPTYNFSYVDQIYDGLLENGVKPFVELSFMPRELSVKPPTLHAFWYHPLVSPPRDYQRWGELVYQLTRHLVERYGVDEVASWYFEVWNEPNIDFWAGEPKEETYYQLYDHAARAIKRVSPRLRVGGPATAQAAWVDRFIRHCVEHDVPFDFVSTHVYGNDTAQNVFGAAQHIPREEMVCRAAAKVQDQVKHSARPDIPIIWSEYNASYMNEVEVTDSSYMGPWLANTIRQCDGKTTMMAYWTFSDVFDEQGVVRQPFYGGFGLISSGGVEKPAFNAFRLLHRLGSRRISSDSKSVLITTRPDGSLAVAVWNLTPAGQPGTTKQVTLQINGVQGAPQVRIRLVDEQHGSFWPAYRAMHEPAFPTQQQFRELRKAAELPPAEVRKWSGGTVQLELPPHALALVEVQSGRRTGHK